MHEQIISAISLLMCLIDGSDTMDSDKMDNFQSRLFELLLEKFEGHWYPRVPLRGNAYRCLRHSMFNKHEEVLIRACRDSGLDYQEIVRRLPPEFTIWIDPDEVCYRIEETGPIYQVAKFN